ncbi:MAG TPA: TraB/GumN family protein [Dyella sp.]|uniref:TraB/GumN family protein n=1 Tax=Dyella sp. TaxID=1869338 RepID=UPI002CF500D4|nr:TraB/GumN family protein [Dyella sp.]HTV85330.1 TraB/GumN family protein [Dyella sp.]
MRIVMVMVMGWLAAWPAAPTWAQSAPVAPGSAPAPARENVKLLQAVTVTGEQPGPGLWKVSKGNHVMWVLGTLTPLPRHMEWRSAEVDRTLAQSQEMLEAPSADLKVDAGFFGKLALLPSVYGARKNPGGESLRQILPPDMYTRWEALKLQYLGDDHGIEYWRPILVAWKLYQKALDKAGLTNANDVLATVRKLADRHDVKRTPVKYQLVVEHPREALDTIKETNLHDISCFNQTLNIVGQDMGQLTARANAWSTGDIATLRSLSVGDRHESCLIAVINADVAQQLGLHDLPQRMEAMWQQAAVAAIARNTQTFAVLPMREVLSPDGYLAHLKAMGYTVQSPEDLDP